MVLATSLSTNDLLLSFSLCTSIYAFVFEIGKPESNYIC